LAGSSPNTRVARALPGPSVRLPTNKNKKRHSAAERHLLAIAVPPQDVTLGRMHGLAYYRAHGPLTEPGEHAGAFAGLPADLPAHCRFVQGIVLHADWASAYGVTDAGLSRETLPVAERMKLAKNILPANKTPGTCRDFALMLCSILRQRGTPARVRCGFATYFTANPFEDHWVCEYWRSGDRRWALADAQLDELQRRHLNIDFDTADLPSGKFLNAGQAWSMWRAGKADAMAFGHGEARGAWFLRVNLMRDQLALQKREISDWDAWRSLSDRDKVLSAEALAECDQIAAATKGGSP
jgi:hypothetical protein